MKPPIVVAGGGLAGAAAAAGLAQAGQSVTLIERETGPVDKICGEFLSGEAQQYLARLGLDINPLGGAHISHLRIIRGAKTVSTALPFQAIGLSRHRLDEALLSHARDAGVQILRGHSIRSIDGITLDVENIGILKPDILMLATGKHEVRGAKRGFNSRKNLIGFKTYFRLSASARSLLENHVELIFFPGGYAGLQMIEDEITNLCLLVDRDHYQNHGGSWAGLLEYLQATIPVLAARLAGAVPILPQPLTIYQVPYGFIHQPHARDCANLFRLGDQACVIHSFTGDGMSIALHSAALAVEAVIAGDNAMPYQRKLARQVRFQIRRADLLYRLMSNPQAQTMLFGLAQLWPAVLKTAARMTRLPMRSRLV